MLHRHAGQTLQEFHEEINLYFKNKLWCCLNFGPDSEPRLKLQEEICGILKETTGDLSRTWTDPFSAPHPHVGCGLPRQHHQSAPPQPSTMLSLIPSLSCLHETVIRNIQMLLHWMCNFILTYLLSPGEILGHSLTVLLLTWQPPPLPCKFLSPHKILKQ